MEVIIVIGSYRRRGCTCKVKNCKCNNTKCTCSVKKCVCGAKWEFRVDIGINPKTGRRKQKSKGGFKTRAEAVAAATKIYSEIVNGTYVAEKNVIFKDFAEQWLKMYEASGKVRNSTIDIRRDKLKLIVDYFAHLKIKDITKINYQEMLDDLKRKGYARKTISSAHETGRLIFQKAREMEIMGTDPTAYAKVPVFQQTVEQIEGETDIPKYLEKEELANFLQAAKDKRKLKFYVGFLTLAYTGLRIGELCVLKWKDIDFKDQKISVSKTLYCKGPITNYKLNPPKTKESKRIIDVDKIVLDELERLKVQQNIMNMKTRDKYHDEDFVFTQDLKYPGYPENPYKFERCMTRILKIAGLNESPTPHSLRHTHTSLLAEAGVDLELIMERLGHKSDRVTREIYLHVTKTRKKEASQKFAELMKGL
jgi:integrase